MASKSPDLFAIDANVGVSNMIEMNNLTEETLRLNLEERYNKDLIYVSSNRDLGTFSDFNYFTSDLREKKK